MPPEPVVPPFPESYTSSPVYVHDPADDMPPEPVVPLFPESYTSSPVYVHDPADDMPPEPPAPPFPDSASYSQAPAYVEDQADHVSKKARFPQYRTPPPFDQAQVVVRVADNHATDVQLFQALNKNDDNVLDREEIKTALRRRDNADFNDFLERHQLGFTLSGELDSDTDAVMAYLDANNDGTVSLIEFMNPDNVRVVGRASIAELPTQEASLYQFLAVNEDGVSDEGPISTNYDHVQGEALQLYNDVNVVIIGEEALAM